MPRVTQSAQVIICGNQKHNYLNAITAEQLMAGKQLLISTSLKNPFGTSIIDQHLQKSTNLIGFYHFFLEQSEGVLIVFFSTRFQKDTRLQFWNSQTEPK